jgi:hypothetical protein
MKLFDTKRWMIGLLSALVLWTAPTAQEAPGLEQNQEQPRKTVQVEGAREGTEGTDALEDVEGKQGPSEKTSSGETPADTAGNEANEDLQKAVEMEEARKAFEKQKDVEGTVVGVVPVDTFMEVSSAFRKLFFLNDGNERFLNDAGLYELYLQAYIASIDGLTLADVKESRLQELMTELEASQLGARAGGEMKKEWLGVDAFVSPGYGYAKPKGWGPAPRGFSRLKVVVPQKQEKFTVVNAQAYSYGGSSDPLMAYNAVRTLKYMLESPAEQREMIGKITEASEKSMSAESAGWILTLLAGAEYIVAGVFAQRAEQRAENAGEKALGFTIAKWGCYALGGFSIAVSPLNPIAAAIQKNKANKLKKEFEKKFGEPYRGGEMIYKSTDRADTKDLDE